MFFYLLVFQKKTSVCLAIDYTRTDEIESLLELAGPYICAVKLHADIIENFDLNFMLRMLDMSEARNYVILEDRQVFFWFKIFEIFSFILLA